MNALGRVRRRLRGENVDRAPNLDILMARAAHHVGRPLARYYLDHRVLVEANLAVQEAFDLDVVQAISDPYREAADMGLEVEFPEDGIPVRRAVLLATPGDLQRLRAVPPASGRRMSDRLACDLRGDTALLLDIHDRPEWLSELLERLVEQQVAFARAQVEAGAHMIGLGDAVASLVSPKQYRAFALPCEQRIFAAVREAGAITRLHICGDTSHLLADMGASGAEIVDLDWMVDLQAAARAWGDDGPAPCGNFDPVAVMLRGTPEDVASAVRSCAAAGGPRHFSATGCEIPDGTPDANISAHTATLHGLGPSVP